MATFESIVGLVPSRYNSLWDGTFDLSAVEYFGFDGLLAWNTDTPSFPSQWPTGDPTCGITQNATAAPDGTTTGSAFTEDSNNRVHQLRSYHSTMTLDNIPVRYAVIAKANTRTRFVGRITVVSNNGSDYADASVGFDLAGGNFAYDKVVTAGMTITASNMASLGSGWWLCTFDAVTTSGYYYWYTNQVLDNGSGTAARSISYAGNGSGIYVWKAVLLPTAAWSLRNLAFSDDFDSSYMIDMGNVRTPGFNWYVANKWLDCVMPLFGFTNYPPAPTDHMSVAGSVLTWADVTGYNVNYIYTATANPADASTYIGSTFRAPAMFECRARWGTPPQSPACWPAFWAVGVEGLIGTSNQYLEMDFFEQFGGGFGDINTTGLAAWQGPGTELASAGASSRIFTAIPGLDTINDFHTYSSLWISSTETGTGVLLAFFDGIAAGTLPFSAGSYPDFRVGDPQHMVVILSGGNGGLGVTWPTYYDWVKVYTESAPTVIPTPKFGVVQ